MSDTRLIIAGIILVFAGFLLGGIISAQYMQFIVQANQFNDCFDYSQSGNAVKVKCDEKVQEEYLYLGLSVASIGSGIFVLIKGIRGKWDQNVKSDEMVGPKNS